MNTEIQISSSSVHRPPSECLTVPACYKETLEVPDFLTSLVQCLVINVCVCMCAHSILMCAGLCVVPINLMRKEDGWLKGNFLPDR